MDRQPFQVVGGGLVMLWGEFYEHRIDLPREYSHAELLDVLFDLFDCIEGLSPGEVREQVLTMLEVDRVFGGDPESWDEEGVPL